MLEGQARERHQIVEAGLALDRTRLRGQAALATADQPVAAEADADGGFNRAFEYALDPEKLKAAQG